MKWFRQRQRQCTKLTILIYNEGFSAIPSHIPNCPVDHEIVRDHTAFKYADAVIFHIPTLSRDFSLRRRRGQVWVAYSGESDVYYPRLRSPRFMRQFDRTMTYRLDSDIPIPYVWPLMTERLLDRPRIAEKTGDAVYFVSSPFNQSGRNQYVATLMGLMPVDSYGAVMNNCDLPDDQGRSTKLEVISRYRFTLAFENSITEDYVTEKFYDPLLVGSVPVYLGAPNVDRFAPGEHCYISTSDFSGPQELAAYLIWLREHPAAYAEYFEWKARPLREEFVRIALEQKMHPIGRLCMWLADRRELNKSGLNRGRDSSTARLP